MNSQPHPTQRKVFWALLILVPLVGLETRANAMSLPRIWSLYAPDALWALLVFILVVLLAPRLPPWKAASVALGIAFLVELSQLYQALWINAVRATRLGGLVLGFGFLWSDLACYTLGVTCGLLLALGLERKP